MTPRRSVPDDLEPLARLWHDAWHETHAPLMPPALARIRTVHDFRTRLAGFGEDLRVAGPPGEPMGFCAIRGDELHQLFLAPAARGTGLGGRLLADGESRIAAAGHRRAWLDCAVGNDKAIRFYTCSGWVRREETELDLPTADGIFRARVLILEKSLRPDP